MQCYEVSIVQRTYRQRIAVVAYEPLLLAHSEDSPKCKFALRRQLAIRICQSLPGKLPGCGGGQQRFYSSHLLLHHVDQRPVRIDLEPTGEPEDLGHCHPYAASACR